LAPKHNGRLAPTKPWTSAAARLQCGLAPSMCFPAENAPHHRLSSRPPAPDALARATALHHRPYHHADAVMGDVVLTLTPSRCSNSTKAQNHASLMCLVRPVEIRLSTFSDRLATRKFAHTTQPKCTASRPMPQVAAVKIKRAADRKRSAAKAQRAICHYDRDPSRVHDTRPTK
jgi:hypothetical protein